MDILGFLHRKKHEDIDTIRSHILGEPPMIEPEPEPFPEPARRSPGYGRFGSPPAPRLNDEIEQFDAFAPPQRERAPDYEISRRLEMIEAQLSAIRSQTETINERLKNMETKLARRY